MNPSDILSAIGIVVGLAGGAYIVQTRNVGASSPTGPVRASGNVVVGNTTPCGCSDSQANVFNSISDMVDKYSSTVSKNLAAYEDSLTASLPNYIAQYAHLETWRSSIVSGTSL